MKRKNHALPKPVRYFHQKIIGSEEVKFMIYPSFWKRIGFDVTGYGDKYPSSKVGGYINQFPVGAEIPVGLGSHVTVQVTPKVYNNGNLLIKVARRMMVLKNGIRNARKIHARFAFVVKKQK